MLEIIIFKTAAEKNAFESFNRQDRAQETNSELERMPIKTSKTDRKKEKNYEKDR